MTMITDDTCGSGITGRRTVGTTVLQLGRLSGGTASRGLTRGVHIIADSGNAGTIYVGYVSNLTANGADDTDGFPLAAGKEKFFPVDDVNKLFLKASQASQVFWFHGC